jgi:hypothetical protein
MVGGNSNKKLGPTWDQITILARCVHPSHPEFNDISVNICGVFDYTPIPVLCPLSGLWAANNYRHLRQFRALFIFSIVNKWLLSWANTFEIKN